MIELKTISEDMKVLKKYYNSVRLVDPLLKKIINSDGTHSLIPEAEPNAERCYQTWANGHVCMKCISVRAALENDIFVKLEDVNGKLYMITALPIRLSNRVWALELIKDVTNQDAVESLINNLGEDAKCLDIRASISRLNELVVKDGLTGVYNRRFINEKLPVQMIKATLEKVPLSLIMADIDHFKRINDQYGHVAGDEVLKDFAAEMAKHIRLSGGDWVARYGGEEFLVCMLNCDKKTAYKVADRIREAIESMEFNTIAGALKITASFGVHTFCGEDVDVSQLLNLVDRNLCQAKNSGRSCIITN